jgi:hypothetical protein
MVFIFFVHQRLLTACIRKKTCVCVHNTLKVQPRPMQAVVLAAAAKSTPLATSRATSFWTAVAPSRASLSLSSRGLFVESLRPCSTLCRERRASLPPTLRKSASRRCVSTPTSLDAAPPSAAPARAAAQGARALPSRKCLRHLRVDGSRRMGRLRPCAMAAPSAVSGARHPPPCALRTNPRRSSSAASRGTRHPRRVHARASMRVKSLVARARCRSSFNAGT